MKNKPIHFFIFDKHNISLYVIGKYNLKLYFKNNNITKNIFSTICGIFYLCLDNMMLL